MGPGPVSGTSLDLASNYIELTRLAIDKRIGFVDMKYAVSSFVVELVKDIRQFFGSPSDVVFCFEVDRDYNAPGESGHFPEPCYYFDTFWRWCLKFIFLATK